MDGVQDAGGERNWSYHAPFLWVTVVHVAISVAVQWCMLVDPFSPSWRVLDSGIEYAQIILVSMYIGLAFDSRASRALLCLIPFVANLAMLAANVAVVRKAQMVDRYLLLNLAPFLFFGLWSWGLRLRRFRRGSMPPPRQLQFSLRKMLAVTTCMAALLAIAAIPAMLGESPTPLNDLCSAFAISAQYVVVLGTCICIPLSVIWLTLTPGKSLPRLVAVLVGWGFGAILLFQYMSFSQESLLLFSLSSFVACMPVLLVTLLVLRGTGYRMVWITNQASDPGKATREPTRSS